MDPTNDKAAASQTNNELFVGGTTIIVGATTLLALVTSAGWARVLSYSWLLLLMALGVVAVMIAIRGTSLSARVWDTTIRSTMYGVGLYIIIGLILANNNENPSVNAPGVFLLLPLAVPVILLASFVVSLILLKLFGRR